MRQKVLLWLDDVRDPFTDNWRKDFTPDFTSESGNHTVWVKNYDDFVQYIQINGLPDLIAFDHDLGEDVAKSKVKNGLSKRQARIQKRETKSGYECTKWLVEYLMKKDLDVPNFVIQSANPVGKLNIESLLNNYQKHRNSNK